MIMADKQTKHRGRPRSRTMEDFWAKQREWTRNYYCRNHDVICIKQKIRYYRNKLRDADKADISRIEGKIADLEAELVKLERGADNIEEKQEQKGYADAGSGLVL